MDREFWNVPRRGGNTSWDYCTIDFGILWNSTKICIKFHWNSWNYCGITGIPMELLEFHWDYCTMRNFNYFPIVPREFRPIRRADSDRN
jgi:hypothetical protein